jgi:amino acid adenylation domain-containing protein
VIVGLCLERSVDLVIGMLGILKAGGAYLPLDPEYPLQRLEYMLTDAGAPVVLSWRRFTDRLPMHGATVVYLDDESCALRSQPRNPVARAVGAQNLAYVIYTSGSTGTPKGVMNVHGALWNRLRWMQATYAVDPTDRILHKTPFTFDVSVWELLLPLMSGARLVVTRPEGHRDARYLSQIIREEKITTLHFVPSMLQVFVDSGELGSCDTLRHVFSSGEALPASLAMQFCAQSRAQLHNLYGPTEAAIEVSHYTVQVPEETGVPIGKPIWRVQLHVLDEQLQEVPIGVVGELYIGGAALARGYLNRASLTAERFIASPHGEGERLYRTGDQVRYRADGNIEYLGRADQQVKLRGYRIELGEIESVLQEQPGVGQAVVVAREDVPGEKRLVGYLVCEGERVEVGELRERLRAKLPEYMVPAVLLTLEKLPLTANGKLDRAALPAPDVAALQAPIYVPPRTPIEQVFADIWSEVLHVERVGVHDDFFELGGHSLIATRVIARIRDVLHEELPLRLLFERPTIAGIVTHLLSMTVESADPSLLEDVLTEVEALEPSARSFTASMSGANADAH